MAKVRKRVLAAGFTACIGGVIAALYLIVRMQLIDLPFAVPGMTTPVASPAVSTISEVTPTSVGVAMRYAHAVQDGNCDEVLRMAGWMVDRMRRVALESSDPAVIKAERDKLCEELGARVVEGNVLRFEGIEDQYVFAPGATMEVVGKDVGRTDLSSPVAYRTWIRVTYPNSRTAPLVQDLEAEAIVKPVRAWNVGVNISRADDTVLKAGVVGNLDIDFDSFSFDWPEGGQ
ncbi:MAG: hypothetical protein WC655_12215 [Candidatus Hydrogenedentales bacterium]